MRQVGSEKITNVDDKLDRIKKISGIVNNNIVNESVNNNTLSTILLEQTAANGEKYAIVQEKKYVYIKKKCDETYQYLGGVDNIHEHSYKSYADALKHLNLMFKSINESKEVKKGLDITKKKI